MFRRAIIFTLTLILNLISTTSLAETLSLEPSIGGYSPVSYFTAGKPEIGQAEFSVTHKDKLYYLTSAEQVKIFNQNPDKYQPRHNVCSYSLALGQKSRLDPTNFKVVAGTLLLFHKSDDVDGLELWNNSDISEQELLERADKQYILLKF